MLQDIKRVIDTNVVYVYQIIWKLITSFNKGTYTNIELKTVDNYYELQLVKLDNNSDNVNFEIESEYSYDNTKIEFADGIVRLKQYIGNILNWDFSSSEDYVFDSDKILVTGGVSKLKGDLTSIYTLYHLNSSTGSIAIDSSGNGRNGTTINNPLWVTGKLNNCLQFNGTNQYINCGDIAGFDKTNIFSVEAWIKTTKTSSQCIVSKMMWASPYTGWRVFTANNRVYFDLYGGGGGGLLEVYASVSIFDDSFHHVIVTYDGSNTPSGVKIYIDSISQTLVTTYNNLTVSILNSVPCAIGCRDSNGGERFQGLIDEVAIYTKVLSQADVDFRYNSGSGTEVLLGGYATNNPSIYPNTNFSFSDIINYFIETAIKPVGSEIKYHISSDNGSTWKYWNGSAWIITNNSYTQANIAEEINNNISLLASSGTFKFRALLHSDDGAITPQLDNIEIGSELVYPLGSFEINMNNDIQPVINRGYLSITEEATKPSGTSIKYQYSLDSGSSYNETWLSEEELEIILLAINCLGDGSDKIRFKFQLSTEDVQQSPFMDNLNIVSNQGYKTSGEWESHKYNSGYNNINWTRIDWSSIIPENSTLSVKIRASNDFNMMGEYSENLQGDCEINISGKYLQWKCEMTGNGLVTPALSRLLISYIFPSTLQIDA